jgi:hypothetical protein
MSQPIDPASQDHYPPPGGWSIGDDLPVPPPPHRRPQPSARALWALGILVVVIVVIATCLTLANDSTQRATARSTPSTVAVVPNRPTSIPSTSGSPETNLCGNQVDAEQVATTYLAAALTGVVSADQACVYRQSVSPTATARIRGQLFVPAGTVTATGPSLTYHFQSVTGANSADITVTKEGDGRFWITGVHLH